MPLDDYDRMPQPPDLQALVREAGGYWKISAEQWEAYDRATQRTQAWLAAHHKPSRERIGWKK